MMARQVAKQFWRLGEARSLVYRRRASGKTDRKLTASTRTGLKSLPNGLFELNMVRP